MLLFYIRHGDPIYHPDDLTGLGMRQAEALARRLSLYGLDSIYSSTSKRARLTANPTAQILKREIVELDWCKEDYAYQDFSATNEFGKIKWLFEIASLRSVMVSDEVTALGHRWWEHPQLADPRYRNGYYRIRTETHAFWRIRDTYLTRVVVPIRQPVKISSGSRFLPIKGLAWLL